MRSHRPCLGEEVPRPSPCRRRLSLMVGREDGTGIFLRDSRSRCGPDHESRCTRSGRAVEGQKARLPQLVLTIVRGGFPPDSPPRTKRNQSTIHQRKTKYQEKQYGIVHRHPRHPDPSARQPQSRRERTTQNLHLRWRATYARQLTSMEEGHSRQLPRHPRHRQARLAQP